VLVTPAPEPSATASTIASAQHSDREEMLAHPPGFEWPLPSARITTISFPMVDSSTLGGYCDYQKQTEGR